MSMTLEALDLFCGSLPHAHRVVQWGGSTVWKVGGPVGKVFVIASVENRGALHVTFKCSPLSFDMLHGQPGLRPAPYLASRGLTWVQRTDARSMSDEILGGYIRESHRLAAENLPKWRQIRLGLSPSQQTPAGRAPPLRRSRT